MFTHAVYFKMHDGTTEEERATLHAGLVELIKAPTIADAFIGTPASTERPVIDKNYDFALILRFADKAAHDAYQVDPIHDTFRDNCAPYWSNARIFDAVD